MCKLYLIEKDKLWYGVFTTPEGSSRSTSKLMGNLVSKFTAIAREVYHTKIVVIKLEV